jgi:hypothetical protein
VSDYPNGIDEELDFTVYVGDCFGDQGSELEPMLSSLRHGAQAKTGTADRCSGLRTMRKQSRPECTYSE